MMRWRSVLGRTVIDTSTAESVGSLDGLIIDVSRRALSAMVVGDHVVSWADAEGIGPDAVTISHSEQLREPASDHERAGIAGDLDPISRRVLSDDGIELGEVVDVEFDADSGRVLSLVLDDHEVSGDRILGIGSYALVVESADA